MLKPNFAACYLLYRSTRLFPILSPLQSGLSTYPRPSCRGRLRTAFSFTGETQRYQRVPAAHGRPMPLGQRGLQGGFNFSLAEIPPTLPRGKSYRVQQLNRYVFVMIFRLGVHMPTCCKGREVERLLE